MYSYVRLVFMFTPVLVLVSIINAWLIGSMLVCRETHSPVHDVGQEVVVPQPVVRVHLLVVDRQGPVEDAPLLK